MDIPWSWIRRLNVKITIFPKLTYILNAIPIKIQQNFVEIGMLILKLKKLCKGLRLLKNKKEGPVLLAIKLHSLID